VCTVLVAVLVVVFSMCCAPAASGQQEPPAPAKPRSEAATANPQTPEKDLTKASIEDLMNVEVTSASKKGQKLSRVAAAIFVITQEDIRRSGATNIPDLLRMAPGLDVGQINGSTWAIGARGFNDQFSDKLLVMIDGRIVYTPNFAGVYWDMVDLPLHDIDRIEVIRGPGGSIWGANAVNGVISIFTKRAADTRGTTIEATGGSLVEGAGSVEYGGQAGKATDFRVFTKYFNDGPQEDLNGGSGDDGWHMLRAGFRSDSALTAKDSLTWEGNLYTAREGELGLFLPSITSPGLIPIAEEISLGGGFLQSDWKHQYGENSDSELQVSFTRYRRDDPLERETRDTLYADYQRHWGWGTRQDIILGGGYYFTADNIPGSLTVSFNPQSKALEVFNFFVQDEIALIPDRLYLTVGTKFEHNDYTGSGWMPSIRAAWETSPRQMFWGAVSRALRTPSRNDTDLRVGLGGFAGPNGVPVFEEFIGNPNYQDERLTAYEAGYRTTFSKNFSLDLAAYVNDYDDLQSIEPSASFFQPSPPPPHEVDSLTFANLLYGETHGLELAGKWQVSQRWQISPSFAFEQIHLHKDAASQGVVSVPYYQGNAPERMAQLRSHVELAKRWSWDASAYYVDPLKNQGPLVDVRIPAYTRVDSGITWQAGERFSVSIVGQNLAQGHHLEFDDVFGSLQSGELKRSGYLRICWSF
jgi:iron complex outermembrane receptor protein